MIYEPNILQVKALKAIKQLRKKDWRCIIVMPTGTGKTYLAVLQTKEILKENPKSKILFVCHNGDILSQANKQEFQEHLKDLGLTYGYYNSIEKDPQQVTFATVQTLTRNLSKFKKDYFDFIIVDEAHHYQARTFKKAIKYFKPKLLLGLTATPYRTDRKCIFEICGNIIYESKIKDAIQKKLLTKIDYNCVDNDIDWSKIKWNGTKYDEKDLNRKIIVKEYDESILKEYKKVVQGGHKRKKTICFCATVKHLYHLEKLFNKNGISAIGLASKHYKYRKRSSITKLQRKEIIEDFRKGKYEVIFVRDLFNEGIDIPDADHIMLLRPTESNIIFTQQIGRGLRPMKDYLLVSDFTGNAKKCDINFEVLSQIMDKDIPEEIKKKLSERKGENLKELTIVSNGCKVRLNRYKFNIFRNLPKTLNDAIREFRRIYANKKPTKGELSNKHNWIYTKFRENNLLDVYCIPKLSLKDALEEYNRLFGKNKPLASKLPKWIYYIFKKNGILNKVCITNKEVIVKKITEIIKKRVKEFYNYYPNSKPTRTRLFREHLSIYNFFKKEKLFDYYCQPKDLSNRKKTKEDIIKEFSEFYPNRKPTLTRLYKEHHRLWIHMKEYDLLGMALPSLKPPSLKPIISTTKIINEFNKKYSITKPTKLELIKENPELYDTIKKKGLINTLCKSITEKKRELINKLKEKKVHKKLLEQKESNDTLKKIKKIYGNKKPYKKQFYDEHKDLYDILKKNRMVYTICKCHKYEQKMNLIKIKIGKRNNKILNDLTNGFSQRDLSKKYRISQPMISKIFKKSKTKENLKITPIYIPKTILIPKQRKNKKGSIKEYEWGNHHFKTETEKINIRSKIIEKIQDGDNVLLLESQELSAIREIEKQNKKPNKIVIPNNKEFNKVSKALQQYKTDLKIELINTSVLQYLVDSNEKFDFIWLDYCGAFSYYMTDLDVLFAKKLSNIKLVLTYNLFDPQKGEDDSYYFTRVIDYVLEKVSGNNKIRLIKDISYRYKKTMYNIGFNIKEVQTY